MDANDSANMDSEGNEEHSREILNHFREYQNQKQTISKNMDV